MSHKSFETQCPPQVTHGPALTPQNVEDPSSVCVPDDFQMQTWPTTHGMRGDDEHIDLRELRTRLGWSEG